MKRSFRKTRHTQLREAGVIIILFSLTLPALLGLLVLAIDCGNLYLARIRLTKVTRSASATALNMMAINGWGALVTDPEVVANGTIDLGLKTANVQVNPPRQTSANQAVLQEMQQSVIDALSRYYPREDITERLRFRSRNGDSSPSPTLDALDLTDSSVSITLRYAAPTYLLGALANTLGISGPCTDVANDPTNRCWVESVPTPDLKTGRLLPSNVLMLLDVSGSMNESVNGRSKSVALIEAASKFIDMFNPLQDRFAVIPYATTADTGEVPVLRPLLDTPGSGEPGYLPVKPWIRDLAVGGQTNHCDALLQVARAIDADPSLQDSTTPKFVLLFTDGAPNVYRLNFCDGAGCTIPPRLATALSNGAPNADNNSPGWYGWTVKWDKREVFRMRAPHDTCPTDGSDGGEVSPAPGHTIPECDPVWAFPKIIRISDGQELSYAEVASHVRLNEDGEFFFKGGPHDGQTLSDLGYSLKFRQLPAFGPRDYHLPDAFRWHGPSYLVHSSFQIPRGSSLIDRIPQSFEDGRDPAVTCGPGSRPPFPGSRTASPPQVADKYSHSRYFASRVVDQDWRWNGSPGIDSMGKADKTRLTRDQRQNAPPYFDLPHTLEGNPLDSPGCLTSLEARVPFTDAEIHVGNNFVSNPRDSIYERGEAVKTSELPYYCAVRVADWLRSQHNVIVYVIGLGPSASSTYGEACLDPLQNSLDPNSRKDNFLRRLAFAPESLADPMAFFDESSKTSSDWHRSSDLRFRSSVSLDGCTNHPLGGLAVELGYSEDRLNDSPGPSGFTPARHGFTPEHVGAYYGTSNPDQLKFIFTEAAKRILMRLSS